MTGRVEGLEMARRITEPNALEKLIWAQNELRRVRDTITPDVAPRVAHKVRALLKSVDGAIRNAENHRARTTVRDAHNEGGD
jgi:hypothetical protein